MEPLKETPREGAGNNVRPNISVSLVFHPTMLLCFKVVLKSDRMSLLQLVTNRHVTT